ncbi:MAG: hypothetical protein IPK82_03740 [Polyangiaceae bacterium]|nr:hypothetical protein [Polyangiaceae bacterium]
MLLFTRPAEPSDFAKKVKAAKEHVAAAVNEGRPLDSKHDFDSIWSQFKDLFSQAQKGKCGFCERDVRTCFGGDVEHYRPKNGIEELPPDEADRGLEDEFTGKLRRKRNLSDAFKSGYWWLAYEWSNYLVACPRCNRTWKRCLFPIAEARTKKPDPEDAETPLLLNPFGPEDPTQHLAYDEFGQITPRDKSARGRATIETCGFGPTPLFSTSAAHCRRRSQPAR